MENLQFGFVKQNPISKQIADTIRKMVLEGQLKSGDKLPGERELAKSMDVGRLSLREGLRILEAEGIIETRYGVNSGTYVSEVSLKNVIGKFSNLLMLSNITLDQLTEARLEIGLINLKYFIERASEEDIERLEKCLIEAENLFAAGMATIEKNILFHHIIALGARNPLFLLLHDSVIKVVLRFVSRFESPIELSRKIIVYNRKLFDYIRQRDLEKAAMEYKEHLTYIKSFWKNFYKQEDVDEGI